MATPLVLKCRSSSGQHRITDLDSESTLLELKAFLLSVTGFEHDKLLIKCGFPPTPIDAGDGSLLKDCGIHNGDVIIVEELKGGTTPKLSHSQKRPAVNSPSSENLVTQSKKPSKENLSIVRKVVPANNSCLFASIEYCLEGQVNQSGASRMRSVVASKILSDKETYTEALLGRTPQAYADWIKKPESWGGGIEISILCEHFMVEIDVVDIKNTRVEKFGEEKFPNRILLIYDGIHYDPLYENSKPIHRTIFPSHDDEVLARALCVAERDKSNRQFTDAGKFKLKCLACGKGFVGGVEATEHAKETQHVNFGEY